MKWDSHCTLSMYKEKNQDQGNIIVRKAKKGEKIKLLDEKIYELNENNLVIADSEKALALAGVMGGLILQ